MAEKTKLAAITIAQQFGEHKPGTSRLVGDQGSVIWRLLLLKLIILSILSGWRLLLLKLIILAHFMCLFYNVVFSTVCRRRGFPFSGVIRGCT